MRINLILVHSLSLLCLCFVSRPAVAAPIDNPGNFVWDNGWGLLEFNQSSPITRTLAASSGSMDTDLDGAGAITFNSFTIHSVVVFPYTVLVQVVAVNSSGTLDASVGGYNTSMSLELKIKITGNLLPNTCVTSTFTRPFEGFYQYDSGLDQGELILYSGSGGSGGSGWLTVPALTSGCAGQEATINSLLGFGGTGQGLNVVRLRSITMPGPYGS